MSLNAVSNPTGVPAPANMAWFLPMANQRQKVDRNFAGGESANSKEKQ